MFNKKSIVLSEPNGNGNKKAVLSLEESFSGINGSLRLYNFQSELKGVSSLGFYVNKNVYKAGLVYKSNSFYEFFLNIEKIPNSFSCALINFQNANPKPILYGSSDAKNENIYGDIISQISNGNSKEKVENILNEANINYDEEYQKEIEKEIDKNLCENCGDCSSCIYKKYFYENNENVSAFSQFEEPVEESLHNDFESEKNEDEAESVDDCFVGKLKKQIDRIFELYPVENDLQNKIPFSKWVKVDYEDDGDFYVFGLMYDDKNNIKYVCYGVPGIFENKAPKELSGYPIWLPIENNREDGFGYWLTYQDAITGEPVKVIMD